MKGKKMREKHREIRKEFYRMAKFPNCRDENDSRDMIHMLYRIEKPTTSKQNM
jgi:hypothetical protein